MIIIRKTVIVSVLVLGLFGVWAMSRNQRVLAQNSSAGTLPTIVDRIAEKFGLKKSDVQSVFDNFQTDRQTAREARYEEWLNQEEKNGKISGTQKNLILSKHRELLNKRQTDFNRRKSEKQALLDWANQNKVDPSYLIGGFGPKMGLEKIGMGHRRGWK